MNETEKEKIRLFCMNELKDNFDLFDWEHQIDSSLSLNENLDEISEKIKLFKESNPLEKIKRENIKMIKESLKEDSEVVVNKWIKESIIKSKIYATIGKRDCMPKGTLVKTPNGKIPIEKVKDVFSYNLSSNKIETKKAKVFNSGLKQVVRLHTKKGIIECSPEHKWIVVRDKQIVTIKTKDLNIRDYLLVV